MANIRGLKKDINFVVNELIFECFTCNYIFPEKNNDELATIISETLVMGDELLAKVNHVKSDKGNSAKKQYNEIRKTLTEKTEKFVERLDNLEK